jgi:hypothetical protein
MSAFQCSDDHILAIATGSLSREDRRCTKAVNEAARIRFEANDLSLKARYGNGCEGPAPRLRDIFGMQKHLRLNPVVIIKLCRSFAYQACEYEGWEKSEAKRIVEHARAQAERNLPGYEEAPWSI